MYEELIKKSYRNTSNKNFDSPISKPGVLFFTRGVQKAIKGLNRKAPSAYACVHACVRTCVLCVRTVFVLCVRTVCVLCVRTCVRMRTHVRTHVRTFFLNEL